MSHNSTSLKQLLLFLQIFTWREYEAPSPSGVFCFVLMFKQVYGIWLIDAINFSFPWNHRRDLNEIIRNRCLLKCLYISGKSIHKYGRLGLWLFDVFQTSAVKLLYGFQRNFSGSKYLQKSLNLLVFLLVQPNKVHNCPGIWLTYSFSISLI